MKIKSTVLLSLIVIAAAGAFFIFKNDKVVQREDERFESEENESQEKRAFYNYLRVLHEFNMVKDPVTNKIPKNIYELEVQQALSIPVRDGGNPMARGGNLNTYIPAGPNNIGGRTRAVAFDKRNSNVIIAGCISGGIYRSTDGGANWTRVTPQGEIHNFSTIAQDPRAGSEDTWYAGGGEPIANSASGPFAFYLSEGVWKSTNNGASWTKLPLTIPSLSNGTLEGFDHPFDMVHKIVVHPTNGNVYVAGHRRLIRSLNGGSTWEIAFNTASAGGSANGQMEIAIANTGKLVLAVNGAMPDASARGVWTSTSGATGTWTRIAGGSTLGVDSVAGWRGNDYTAGSKRILLGLAPSNQNLLYVLYENGLSQSATTPVPEVDMYKLDITAASPVWTNLSANMPDFPGQRDGVDPIAVQEGYDMLVAVKPDNPDVVFVGGTCLYRSTNGFTSTGTTAWIAGYGNTLPTLTLYPNSHPDIHTITFDPANPNRAICGNDGGIQVTTNVMANVTAQEPVTWTMIRNYQTLQYYHIAMDPGSGRNNFTGGAQDNGTHYRFDGSDDHFRIVGGDGGAAGIAKVSGSNQIVYCSSQLGDMYRATLNGGTVTAFNNIKPTGLTATPGGGFGDFVTYFKIDFDNPEDAYYVNFNRLFRTTNASTVSSSGWTELTGVGAAVNPSNPTGGTNILISALETSRGDYFPSHSMYIGTSSGKIFRLDNPRNTGATTSPVDITPPSLPSNTYISDIASNPNNDEEIMIVVSNYLVNNNPVTNIWWTNNAKSSAPTWKAAEGNLTLPSIRSAQIVVKKDASNNPVTEYYVGTSVGLYSAVNIGPTLLANQAVSWVREGDNTLNLAVINTLDYRPADNIFLVGTHGNGLYYANTGTPNYTPNLNTGVDDPVRNDKHFIEIAYPTIIQNQGINYKIGNMFTIKGLVVQVYSNTGQLLSRKETSYSNGSVDTDRLPKGSYILTITSNDYKQQFVQPFVKN
ncbi:MAG TPA: T9SS type A sorting domain-containing protein [Chitinophagaceae bacterium]|nr:T9SS type A sorting domain-containing protein [Chitinophagaceae bacterium]